MFLQRFTCCLPHSLGCLLPACHDRQFRHQIVFLLHTIQHIHASQMHMISQIKYVFTKIYFNRFPKGGTSRRPFVYENIWNHFCTGFVGAVSTRSPFHDRALAVSNQLVACPSFQESNNKFRWFSNAFCYFKSKQFRKHYLWKSPVRYKQPNK